MPTSGGGNGGSGGNGDGGGGAGDGSGAGGGDGHGATVAFTREDVKGWNETKIQDELYSSDNRLRVYVSSLDGNQSLKDISDKKAENSAISRPLAILIAGINDKISSDPKVADNLKKRRTHARQQQTCLNDVNNILNKLPKEDGGFSETICRNGSFGEVTIIVSRSDTTLVEGGSVTFFVTSTDDIALRNVTLGP